MEWRTLKNFMMIKIDIKALSVNRAWKGRRFKTDDYKFYEIGVTYLLPRMNIPKGKLEIFIEFGFSSKAADVDNPVKPFVDILQKKYKFNDKMIYSLHLKKADVKKGKEYICFEIKKYA